MYLSSSAIQTDCLLSCHAKRRMAKRGADQQTVNIVLDFGREVRSRGAVFYVIGKKEIAQFQKHEPLLKDMEGWQMLTAENGLVITTYRNKDLRRTRPHLHRLRYSH